MARELRTAARDPGGDIAVHRGLIKMIPSELGDRASASGTGCCTSKSALHGGLEAGHATAARDDKIRQVSDAG
jgi:hypothetical protein